MQVLRKLQGLNEANPMLGLRGCRLGIRHPDITEMQVGGRAGLGPRARALGRLAGWLAGLGVERWPP